MLSEISKKEILHSIAENRLTIIFLVCIVLFSVSAFVQSRDYQRRLDIYSSKVSSGEQEQGAIKRPEDLSILVKGIDATEQAYRPINPLSRVFMPLDFSYLVETMLSLIAILLASGLISKEKEQGTLKLMLSNPVPRDVTLLGEWSGAFVILITPFLLSSIAYVLYISLGKGVAFNGADYIRIGLIGLVSILYLSCFFNLGLFISTRTHRSSTATVSALIAWIAFVFLIPNLSPLISKGLVHPTSAQTIDQRKFRVRQEIRLKRVKRILSVDEYYEQIKEQERRLDEVYRNSMKKFVNVTKNIARLSPASSFVFTVTTLAKTGIEDREAYKNFLREGNKRGEKFVQAQISLSTSLDRTLLDIVLMVIFNLLFFILSHFSFLRYDVR